VAIAALSILRSQLRALNLGAVIVGGRSSATPSSNYRIRGPVSLKPGEAGVAHDGEKHGLGSPRRPSKKRYAAIPLLRDILRVVIVARQPAREVIGCVEMGKHDLFKITMAALIFHWRLRNER